MKLIEQTQVPEAALPVAEFRDHLQLGSGFADDGLQDPVLTTCLRAAISAVEGDTNKALISRQFQYVLAAWRDFAKQTLPIAPVSSVLSVSITDIMDVSTVIDQSQYRLMPDYYRPSIEALGWSLPVIPDGGTVEIVFIAGFGAAWSDVPADIAQAVYLLAAHFYDNRSAMSEKGRLLPHGVSNLLRRYRPIRLLGGGR